MIQVGPGALVGRRLKVVFDDGNAYPGTVEAFDPEKQEHKVRHRRALVCCARCVWRVAECTRPSNAACTNPAAARAFKAPLRHD